MFNLADLQTFTPATKTCRINPVWARSQQHSSRQRRLPGRHQEHMEEHMAEIAGASFLTCSIPERSTMAFGACFLVEAPKRYVTLNGLQFDSSS
ncbi:MAG: hypothetical protein OJF50_006219 [Nitrospira sp.]|nr:hypothetical protein [Nitrospira sp.]